MKDFRQIMKEWAQGSFLPDSTVDKVLNELGLDDLIEELNKGEE